MSKPKKAPPSPAKRAFARQLRAWFEQNREAWYARRDHIGPRNAEQLADLLRASGEEVTGKTVRFWQAADNLPESRFVALLERFIGAPWTYIIDERAPLVDEDVRAAWSGAQKAIDALARAQKTARKGST
jgi:hypothetical protein